MVEGCLTFQTGSHLKGLLFILTAVNTSNLTRPLFGVQKSYTKISLTEMEVGNKMQKCFVPSLFSGFLVTTLWMGEIAFKYRRYLWIYSDTSANE
jgi:hypothetical protein